MQDVPHLENGSEGHAGKSGQTVPCSTGFGFCGKKDVGRMMFHQNVEGFCIRMGRC